MPLPNISSRCWIIFFKLGLQISQILIFVNKMGRRRVSFADDSSIPALCRFWGNLSQSLPCIQVFGLDIALTLCSIVFLACVRVAAEYTLIHKFGWPLNDDGRGTTQWASASLAAILHSINLCFALWACLRSQPYQPSQKMSEAPEWWQESVTALLQFCTGYMVYDSVCNILIPKWGHLNLEDLLFFGHHLITTFYMTSTRVYAAGHFSAMACMFLGESTNPLQNGYLIAEAAMKLDCCNGDRMALFYTVIQFLFASCYCVMRAIVCPLVAVHVTYDFWTFGRAHLPKTLLALWTVLIWAILIGSIPWIVDCWSMLTPYLPESIRQSVGSEL